MVAEEDLMILTGEVVVVLTPLESNMENILALLPPGFVSARTGSEANIRFGENRFGLSVQCRFSFDGEFCYHLLIWDFGPDNEAVALYGDSADLPELRAEDEILAEIFRVQTMLRERRLVEPFFSPAGIALRGD